MGRILRLLAFLPLVPSWLLVLINVMAVNADCGSRGVQQQVQPCSSSEEYHQPREAQCIQETNATGPVYVKEGTPSHGCQCGAAASLFQLRGSNTKDYKKTTQQMPSVVKLRSRRAELYAYFCALVALRGC